MTHDTFCPACEAGELRPDPFLVRCSGCGCVLSRDLFLTLRQIRALPEACGGEGREKSGESGRARGERDHEPEGGLTEHGR